MKRFFTWFFSLVAGALHAIQSDDNRVQDDPPDAGPRSSGDGPESQPPGHRPGSKLSNRDDSPDGVLRDEKRDEKHVEKTMSKRDTIVEVAGQLNVPASWLDGLIAFETAGTYDPKIKNPYSSARGLIQIINSTAMDIFGMTSEQLVNTYPTFTGQMYNVVLPYLSRYAPFPTKQSLYMAVFYPRYRSVPPDTVFPDSVQKVNPGITTVADYVNYVDRKALQSRIIRKVAPGVMLLSIGTAWLYFKNRGMA